MRSFVKIVMVCLLPALLLTGCWSYRSLSDLSIVMGIGVDQISETGGYRITTEIVDLTKSLQSSAPGSTVVVSEGATIFDGVRNAKKKLINRLYIGNIQVMVVSEELARNVGISNVVDWFMRDGECRETVSLLVAQGTSAQDLLSLEGTDQSISSLEMDRIITEDNEITSSTASTELYQVYYTLNCPGASLTLPVFRITENEGKLTFEANGMAAFIDDMLAGFISPEDSKFVLIATNKCRGGLLTLSHNNSGMPDTTLEIQNSKAKTTYTVRGEQIAFQIETETNVFLAETMAAIDVLNNDDIKALEDTAAQLLESEITRVIRMVQNDLKTDIFGFGHMIYQHDARLWEQLQPDWTSIFPTIQVEVSTKVHVKNTAFIKSKEAINK